MGTLEVMLCPRATSASFYLSGILDLIALLGRPGRCLISFWALIRETEWFLALDELPPLSLNLPWAIRRHQWSKPAIRFVLVLSSTLGCCKVCHDIKGSVIKGRSTLWLMVAPMIVLTHFFFLPMFSLIAIRHWDQRN